MAKMWDQPKHPSQDEGITNTVIGFSFRDRGSTEAATTRMDLEDVHMEEEEVDTKDVHPVDEKRPE